MIVVADSSPLIILSKLGCLQYLISLFGRVTISDEVCREVAVSGKGLPGASEVNDAQWIVVRSVVQREDMERLGRTKVLGLGELSTIILAKEIKAGLVLMDDYQARKLAVSEGLQVLGSIGILEALYARGDLTDIRSAFHRLIEESYVDRELLNSRLRALGLAIL